MSNEIFRKKSLDRISSPEQLTDYIKASNPGVWLTLGAIAVLLIGICVWGIFGKLDTKLTVAAESENGRLVCYVKESDIGKIKSDMKVAINGTEYGINDISSKPVSVEEGFEEYALHIGDIKTGEWVFIVSADGSLPDGIYTGEIVIDSVAPMSFVFN